MPEPKPTILCPGQGAQTVGMGRAWYEASKTARQTFEEADEVLGEALTEIVFQGPADRLNRTDIAQPAIYVCSVACHRGLTEGGDGWSPAAAAGLSLGEYTALHLAGTFDFVCGLQLVARRGQLMQEAAAATESGMVALIGADPETAAEVCREAGGGEVLVCANYNAPGQIVLSGHAGACERAVAAAAGRGVQARPLPVAGAFHSPLMQPAADAMAEALGVVELCPPEVPVFSNVTGRPHDPQDMELLKNRLVQQIVSPVRWSETCQRLAGSDRIDCHELAPGNVLRGLMRRIDRTVKVTNHDQPP